MKNFRTYQLATKFRASALALKVRGVVKDQLNRASLSIVLNLAEGSGKAGEKDRRRFFVMAFGSARECQALIDVTNSFGLKSEADVLAAHIYKLCKNPGRGLFE